MAKAVLRAITETGEEHEDPSEDLIFMLLEDIERGEEQFFIIEVTADDSGQTYAQVIRNDDGTWNLERRDGGPGSHFRATCPNLRSAHGALVAWAWNLPDWEHAAHWEQVEV